MPLFNIYLENDDPTLETDGDNALPGDWANEFAQRSKRPADLKDLQSRTADKAVKKAFIKDDVQGDFQTSVVLSKKILDIFMKHPDFSGIRIYLGVRKKPTNNTLRNCFVVVPVDHELRNITGSNSYREHEATAEESMHKSSIAFYTEDGTGCPPRSGCDDSNSFI